MREKKKKQSLRVRGLLGPKISVVCDHLHRLRPLTQNVHIQERGSNVRSGIWSNGWKEKTCDVGKNPGGRGRNCFVSCGQFRFVSSLKSTAAFQVRPLTMVTCCVLFSRDNCQVNTRPGRAEIGQFVLCGFPTLGLVSGCPVGERETYSILSRGQE